MRLSNIRHVGRFRNKITGKGVNIKIGRNMPRGTDHYFYLYRGNRILISGYEFCEFYTEIFEKQETIKQ